MRLFWRKGYAGTSLSDLTAATGVNRPSLYATFGNKEALFSRALDRYLRGPFRYFRTALTAPTAREVMKHLLKGGAGLATDATSPTGCLWVRGALSHGDGPAALRREMAAGRRAGESALTTRFLQAAAEGDLPAGVDPTSLARYVQAVHFGMQVQAATGLGRAELNGVVEVALRALPGPVDSPN